MVYGLKNVASVNDAIFFYRGGVMGARKVRFPLSLV